MRVTGLLLILVTFISFSLEAEGTRELAPNDSITINGTNTTDLAALLADHVLYNNFAAYDNPDPNSRLYINIQDPTAECIYLGFSFGHLNITSPNPPPNNYEYRLLDPNGNIVFGPVVVNIGDENIQTWSQAFTGPMQIHGDDGYDAVHVTSDDLTSEGWTGSGDYYIQFRNLDNGGELLFDFWDITVANCSGEPAVEKKGRIWSFNWAFFAVNDFGFPNRPFNGAFYVCAPDPENPSAAFVTQIDFNGSGFRPAAFNIAFNSFGSANTGDVMSDRRSVELINGTQPEYAIFLNDPVELCETAIPGEFTLDGVGRCDEEGFCINFTASKEGQVDLLIDFDGPDGIYTPGTADVMKVVTVAPEDVNVSTCIDWDGIDGLGNPVVENAGTQIPVQISFAQGIYHFPVFDAEFMTNGFMVNAIRPTGDIPLLYYDDSNITVPSGSGEPAVQLSGCEIPCHRWTNFTNNNVPGFGNLHTINSWWFSQAIFIEEIFSYPANLECSLTGPDRFCEGSSAILSVDFMALPEGAELPVISALNFTGPNLTVLNSGTEIEVFEAGTYEVEVEYLSGAGETCTTTCSFTIDTDPTFQSVIDTLVVAGADVIINEETYNGSGQYEQLLFTSQGCDSLLIINIYTIETAVHYDLNACVSYSENGTDMDYSEFTAAYPSPVSCAEIVADFLFRDNPTVNKHSCTPGVNDSPAMCVSSLDTCEYIPGHEMSTVFEVTINPAQDTAVRVTAICFFEKAPESFDWIDGPSGLNNYPTLFAVRVLANGSEIFLDHDLSTSPEWSEEVFSFGEMEGFTIVEPTTFRFELLGYCLVGNGAPVTAWDLDEISVEAACLSPGFLNKNISGNVLSESGKKIPGVDMRLMRNSFGGQKNTTTDEAGAYLFTDNRFGASYSISGEKDTDHMTGVSTLDLLIIQKHLIGAKSFHSPYQYLAADINNNQLISAIDLLELRKLILGIYETFPDNSSYRVGPFDQNMNLNNPWSFEEEVYIESLRDDLHDMDFIGIKVGDVNDTALQNSELDGRSSQNLTLTYTDQWMDAGRTYTMPVFSTVAQEIYGIQFALDNNSMGIQEMSAGSIPLTGDHVGFNSSGEFRLSWSHFEPTHIKRDEVAFYITISPSQSGQLSNLIQTQSQYLAPEAYVGEALDVYPVRFEAQSNLVDSENNMVRVYPNPLSDEATISFSLYEDGPASITFFNLSGQELKRIDQWFSKGMNEVKISIRDLNVDHGVVIVRCEMNNDVQSLKIVLVE